MGKDSNIFLVRNLTIAKSHSTISRMNEIKTKMDNLEEQANDLLGLCQRLSEENSDLRKQLNDMSSERAGLVELKEKARNQVEGMITRLRAMENA
ncbi:MAG: TIGR02449 family protein [Gammaproteobacteria bacterium]|nr:TIGR02449 family protein [Gammaproteobacteria bacterium]